MIGPIPYIGGKRRIARQIISLIPPHTTYVEPFAGGAQVFFHKPPSRVEVLNDLDDEIVNFLRIAQRHPNELIRVLRWQPAARKLFEWHRHTLPEHLTDVERAAQFFYLQKNCWSGLRTRKTFHFSVTKPANYRLAQIERILTRVAQRLNGVQIEHSSYSDVLTRYDRPTTFFYCDPPYVGLTLYEHNFSERDFQQLAERLGSIKGRFLLSINDCQESRSWFGRFASRTVDLLYTSPRNPKRRRELLFANYPLESGTDP